MSNLQNKKRIMLIVPMLHQGGFERICALTAKLLNDRCEVHLVIFSSEDMIYDVSGIHLIDLQLGAVPGKIGKLKNIVKRIYRLKKLKRELGIQISYSFGTTANLANVLSKTKDVTWAGIRGYGALEEHLELIGRRADRVISCTKVMEEDIKSRVAIKKSATLYNPCNLSEIEALATVDVDNRFVEFFKRPGKLVVSMGREDDIKGFWHLIKSIYLLRKKLPNVKLMIIGDGDYLEYKKLVQDFEMEEDVLFAGVHRNPFPLLAKADLYALTSDTEGFPNALIEAMACGVPCVSVNCKTGPAEILHENYQECENQEKCYHADYGILAPVLKGEKDLQIDSFTKEEQIFAEEMEQILTDTQMWEAYRSKTKKRAKDFGMESYVAQISRLIEEDSAV